MFLDRGLGGRFAQNRGRRGLWSGGELPTPPQNGGGLVTQSAHKHSRAGLCRQDSAEQSFPAVPGTYAVLHGGTPGRIGQTNEPTSPSRPPIHPRRIREPGGSRPSRPRPADHDRPSLPRRSAAVGSRSTADVGGCAGGSVWRPFVDELDTSTDRPGE